MRAAGGSEEVCESKGTVGKMRKCVEFVGVGWGGDGVWFRC